MRHPEGSALKKSVTILFTALTLSLSALTTVHAETQYVSDHLVITLRSGQGAQFQILKTLVSGTRLEILETTDTGYTKVRTPEGTEGWVRTQYLTTEPIAQEKLANLEAQLQTAKTELSQLKESYTALRKERNVLASEKNKFTSDNSQLETELDRLKEVAAKPIILDRENRELQQKNVALEKDVQRLSQENRVLKDSSKREWIIAGALILFIGIVFGLVMPKLFVRRRSSW